MFVQRAICRLVVVINILKFHFQPPTGTITNSVIVDHDLQINLEI